MNLTVTKIRAIALAFLLGIVLSFSLAFMTPVNNTTSFASVGDVDVRVDGSGKLSVSGGNMDYNDSASAMNAFIKKYRTVIVGVSGIACVSMIAFFIFNFMKLGASSANPADRTKAIQGLLFSGIAAAGLGAVTLIVGYFYNAAK